MPYDTNDFLRSTRLFDGKKKPHRPKRRTIISKLQTEKKKLATALQLEKGRSKQSNLTDEDAFVLEMEKMLFGTTGELCNVISNLEQQIDEADLRAHEKNVKELIENGLIWKSQKQKQKGFFTCPYFVKLIIIGNNTKYIALITSPKVSIIFNINIA